jgi:hypothetical protein
MRKSLKINHQKWPFLVTQISTTKSSLIITTTTSQKLERFLRIEGIFSYFKKIIEKNFFFVTDPKKVYFDLQWFSFLQHAFEDFSFLHFYLFFCCIKHLLIKLFLVPLDPIKLTHFLICYVIINSLNHSFRSICAHEATMEVECEIKAIYQYLKGRLQGMISFLQIFIKW